MKIAILLELNLNEKKNASVCSDTELRQWEIWLNYTTFLAPLVVFFQLLWKWIAS